jgi:peroxiredoxin family protein
MIEQRLGGRPDSMVDGGQHRRGNDMTAVEKKEAITMIVYGNNFDKLMMPMIVAQGAVAMGWEVNIFYTFFGLQGLLRKFKPKLPGMFRFFTGMIQKRMAQQKVPSYHELMKSNVEMGANIYACNMSMKMMGWKIEDMFEGVKPAGVAKYLDMSADAAINLAFG